MVQWMEADLNRRLHAYQACVLTRLNYPSVVFVRKAGLEPAAFAESWRRSTKLSYSLEYSGSGKVRTCGLRSVEPALCQLS
jgi:hypothetical protein